MSTRCQCVWCRRLVSPLDPISWGFTLFVESKHTTIQITVTQTLRGCVCECVVHQSS